MAWNLNERGKATVPYVHQPYPAHVYHVITGDMRVVNDEAAHAALGPDFGYAIAEAPTASAEPDAAPVVDAPRRRKAKA